MSRTQSILTCAIAALVLAPAGATPAQRAVTASAQTLLDDALARAREERKTIFVDFRASWCPPCLALQRFLSSPAAAPIMEAHFVVVPITVWEEGNQRSLNTPGGEAMFKKLGGGDGIPFLALLDATGKRVTQSGGFPAGSFGIDDFIETLAKGAPALGAGERATLFEAAASLTNLRVWPAPPAGAHPGTISPSGRFLTYSSAAAGLFVHAYCRDAADMRRTPCVNDHDFSPLSPRPKDSDDNSIYNSTPLGAGVNVVLFTSKRG